jgi:hypothetical protein
VNAPSLFSRIWNILKGYLDIDVQLKVNILSTYETAHSEQRFRDAGIEKDQLPAWLFEGACGKEINTYDLVQDAIKEKLYTSSSSSSSSSSSLSSSSSSSSLDQQLRDYYYPPLNRRITDKLSTALLSTEEAQQAQMATPLLLVTSRAAHEGGSEVEEEQEEQDLNGVDGRTGITNHGINSSGNVVIVALLLSVLLLLIFITWHQVQMKNRPATTCVCSCPLIM